MGRDGNEVLSSDVSPFSKPVVERRASSPMRHSDSEP